MPVKDKGRKTVERTSQKLERLSIEYVPINSIKANPYNPNRQSEHDFNLLLQSMREDGFTQPIVCLRESRDIVDGEHRWRAADVLGYTEVPVVFTDFDPAHARVSTLRHNRARGSEDIDLTAEVMRDLQKLGALDWAQDALQMDDIEMQSYLDDVPAPDALAADDFSQAWEPEGKSAQSDLNTSRGVTSLTPAALSAQREQEQKVAQARTEQERQTARRESTVFHVVCMYADEEAEIVRSILGDAPALKLLDLCKWAKEHGQ